MNKARRARLDALNTDLHNLQAALSEVRDEEQEAFDNLPESLQSGEKGQAMSEAADCMESAHDSIGEAIDSLAPVLGY